MVNDYHSLLVGSHDYCFSQKSICKCNDESVDHLFIHCPVAMDLWSMVLGLFGVSWVMPQSIVGLLACQQGWFGRHRNGHIWIIIPHCLIMCVFGRKEIVGVLKIMRDPYQTSSYFSLELYWIGWLPVYQGVPFFISIKLITYKKKDVWVYSLSQVSVHQVAPINFTSALFSNKY